MKGWTPNGREVELFEHQKIIVEAILRWEWGGGQVVLPAWGHGSGKSVVISTVARYSAARSEGNLLEDDPLRQVYFSADWTGDVS